MKVAHISTYDTGGAGDAAVRLHLGLLNKGVNSSFLSLFKNNPKIPNSSFVGSKRPALFQRVLNRLGLPQLELQKFSRETRNQPKNYETISTPKTDYRELVNHPVVKEADVVNLHFVANFVDYPTFFSAVNKPIVWTIHDMAPIQGVFHYFGDKRRNQDGLGALDRKYESLKVDCLQKQRGLQVVSPSQWLARLAQRSNVFKGHSVRCIPNGLPTDTFKPVKRDNACAVFGLDLAKRYILFVSETKSGYRKGFDILLDAIRQFDPDKTEFLAIGHPKSGSSDIAQKIRFLGRIAKPEAMACAYSLADMLVLPSREDNLPNTMLESLACGTPVVAFRIGGVPDAVKHGINGILCDSVNARSLREGMEVALAKNFNRHDISKNSHDRYALEVQAREYIGLYKNLIQ